ncbi:MAG: hypothetical protein ACXVBE_10515 [Bdellovibrionota bacterium]
MSKKLALLFALTVLAFSGAAHADDHQRENIVRTPTNANETASFKLTKDIYRTETAYQNVCRDEPYYETETYYENEWVPNQQYECTANPDGSQNCQYVDHGSYQQVAHTRQITKWQNVCRDEPYDYEVYDHTWEIPVQVIFPAETVLREGEQEKISFDMDGSERKPKVTIDQSKAIFHYAIQSSVWANNLLTVTLVSKPYLNAKDVGAKNIGAAFLEFNEASTTLRVEDKFSRIRVTTSYKATLTDRKSKAVVGETSELVRDGNYFKAKLPGALDSSKDYVLTLNVHRTGIMLTPGNIDFSVTKTVKAEALDMGKLKSNSLIGHFRIKGVKEAVTMGFRDESPEYVTASSRYKIEVFASRNKEKVAIGSGEFTRKDLKADKDHVFQISFKDDLKMDAANLALLVKKVKLDVVVTATRESKRFAAITVKKTGSLQISK